MEESSSSLPPQAAVNNRRFLMGKRDVYSGLAVRSVDFSDDIDQHAATQLLRDSVERWTQIGVNGVWFEVNVKHVWWLPILFDHGFTIHHALADYVMATRWLLATPSRLPAYPFTSIGVGGLVVDAEGRILLMKEKRGVYLGWKFPGGAADPGELIDETARREVLEETGVEAEFVSVLTFRQQNWFRYKNTGDIYFVCVMRPKDEGAITPKPCPIEAADCKWLTRAEIEALPAPEFHAYLRIILQKYDEWVAAGCLPFRHIDFDHHPPTAAETRAENVNAKEEQEATTSDRSVHRNGFYFFDAQSKL